MLPLGTHWGFFGGGGGGEGREGGGNLMGTQWEYIDDNKRIL